MDVWASDRAADIAAIDAVSPTAAGIVAGWNPNTMLALYDNNPNPATYTRSGSSLDADIASAVPAGSTQVWQLGFSGANPGEFWTASAASNNINVVGATQSPFVAGLVNFAVDQTTVTPYSSLLVSNQTIDGSADLLGIGGATTPFQAFDNTNATLEHRARAIQPGPLGCLPGRVGRRIGRVSPNEEQDRER